MAQLAKFLRVELGVTPGRAHVPPMIGSDDPRMTFASGSLTEYLLFEEHEMVSSSFVPGVHVEMPSSTSDKSFDGTVILQGIESVGELL